MVTNMLGRFALCATQIESVCVCVSVCRVFGENVLPLYVTTEC